MVTDADVARMRAQLFFEGDDRHGRHSRFWLLLVLAAVIAAAGVASDSTATVIGAMIVAPLMTPILGVVLAMVLADRENLMRCLTALVLGTLAVIAVGYLVGVLKIEPVVAATNSQVAGRVSPTLLDLLAALATGAVGSIALMRSDISDTLPGVAIAISLVPPLAVVGLTLQSGAPSEAWGAFILFLANVSAIMATAVVTMIVYGLVRRVDGRSGLWSRPGFVVIAAMVVVVAVPLASTSVGIAISAAHQSRVGEVAHTWAGDAGWRIESVSSTATGVAIHAVGPLPEPSTDLLRRQLDSAGLDGVEVQVVLVPGTDVTLEPAS